MEDTHDPPAGRFHAFVSMKRTSDLETSLRNRERNLNDDVRHKIINININYNDNNNKIVIG